MNTKLKPIIALGTGPILMCGMLCQTAHAALPVSPGNPVSGVATLTDSVGDSTPPEALTVDWTVSESLSDVYTYSYTLYNPQGDVVLPSPGQPGGQTEIVDFFSISFDATPVIANSFTGGDPGESDGIFGVDWTLDAPDVAAGANSGALTFQSYYGPTLSGYAQASDDNAPSPWAGNADNFLPVPTIANIPDSASTMSLLSGVLLFAPFRSAYRKMLRK